MAKIGKARALLDLGRFADAATAVQGIAPSFTFNVAYSTQTGVDSAAPSVRYSQMSDNEGGAGLPFVSAHDPRVGFNTSTGGTTKYANGNTPIPLATGVEAQLIAAEAAFHQPGGDWLGMLNALRTTCTATVGCATPAPAGGGGVAGLPPLSDPGSDTARVSLIFRERAFWLFLTGHRHGDMRRLIRQYGRDAIRVFPNGQYINFSAGYGAYGQSVVFPVPDVERNNPLFHGCIDLNA
jgi:hypothetical protein